MRHSILVALMVAVGATAHLPARQAAIPPALPPASELAALVDRFNLDRGSLFRRYDVDYSPERYARLTKFYQDWQQELARLKCESLGVEGRIDYTLLRSRLEYELRLLAHEQKWVSEAATLVPFSSTITSLLDARGRLESMDTAKTAAQLDTLTSEIARATSAIGAPARVAEVTGIADPVRARQINAFRAAEILSSLRTDLTAWHRYYSGYDPMYSWWAAKPYASADKALADYIKALREKIVGYRDGEDEPIIGNPIGKAALLDDLASEFIPYTPEELLAIAEREFAWCDREMLKASREMGFGDNWRAALEKVKTPHAEPGKQTDLVRDQAREAIEYVTKRDLVTVPPLADETWRMTMMSRERQKVNPVFLGGEVIQVFWRMHRQARIIFSLRFHLGTMTPQECIDLLVERVGHERANAEAEVRRSFNGTYPPLYQLAYMIGGLQFRAMPAELVGGNPSTSLKAGRMTHKQYHDAVLQAGSMPVELVRASLTKQLLPPNFQTTWKFDSATAR